MEQLKNKIINKMCNENCTNLLDETIEQVFKNTCLPTKLIYYAKTFRDFGLITINDLK